MRPPSFSSGAWHSTQRSSKIRITRLASAISSAPVRAIKAARSAAMEMAFEQRFMRKPGNQRLQEPERFPALYTKSMADSRGKGGDGDGPPPWRAALRRRLDRRWQGSRARGFADAPEPAA